eukprot:CAMPEP_0168554890 /NCGR_PEP_ID=MMETSP0413-20121227/8028_1 /TAXON_ID=136452 /ORGANISM="Filamoeba nolandi, Strain NC-AS-23-1" /LENGTH=249 /DNA_ID=CAMNT_0008585675 /DNA_START=189 /DNA_END=938 /DNA_ORIENTATION=-
MHASPSSSPNCSSSDSNPLDEKKAWFQKEQQQPSEPTVLPVSEKEKVCAEMLLSLKQDSDNEDSKKEPQSPKEPEFTDKKTIKKATKMKIRHKRCSNACSEHKRKHQRCPPECLGRKREEQLHQQAAQQQLNHLHQMQQAHFGLPARQSPTHSNQTTPPSSPIATEQYLPIPVMVPTSFYRTPTAGNVLFYPMYPQQVSVPAATSPIPPAAAPKREPTELGSMISRFMTFPQDPRSALTSLTTPITQYL